MGNKAKMNRRSARSSKCRQILKLTSSHTEPTKHWQPHNDLLSCRHHDEVCTYLAGSQVFCLQQTNKSCRVFFCQLLSIRKASLKIWFYASFQKKLILWCSVSVSVFFLALFAFCSLCEMCKESNFIRMYLKNTPRIFFTLINISQEKRGEAY